MFSEIEQCEGVSDLKLAPYSEGRRRHNGLLTLRKMESSAVTLLRHNCVIAEQLPTHISVNLGIIQEKSSEGLKG